LTVFVEFVLITGPPNLHEFTQSATANLSVNRREAFRINAGNTAIVQRP
jgi:hypothetical protein